jgi:hypothetical protein
MQIHPDRFPLRLKPQDARERSLAAIAVEAVTGHTLNNGAAIAVGKYMNPAYSVYALVGIWKIAAAEAATDRPGVVLPALTPNLTEEEVQIAVLFADRSTQKLVDDPA